MATKNSLPRYRRGRIQTLGAVILAGFAIILAAVVVAYVLTAGILRFDGRLSELRQTASRLNSLSKDLLVTDNLFQTFEAWKSSRASLESELAAILDDPVSRRTLANQDGQVQLANTLRLMELIRPRMDRVQQIVTGVMERNSAFSAGLMELRGLPAARVAPGEVNEVRTFSLYIGDLLNQRLARLSDTIARAAVATTLLIALILGGAALVILGIIMVVLRALAIAQKANEETTHYLQGVLAAIFDLSGQGFLTFDQSLRVDPANSRQSARLLGKDPGGLEVATLLWQKPADQQDFRDGMALVFSGKAKPEVVFDLFEKEVRLESAWLRVNFRALPNGRMLLALTDVSREHALRELQAGEEARRNIILKAVSHRQYFAGLVKDANHLFDQLARFDGAAPGPEELAGLLRQVHSFKGNASFFGFRNTAATAHDFEFHLEDCRVLGGEPDIKARSTDLKRAYFTELRHITDSLGETWLDTLDSVAIPLRVYLRLEHYIKQNYGKDKVLVAHLASHRRQPLRDLFARYPDMVQNLATQLGKLVNPVIVEGGDYPVLPERFAPLLSCLVHLVRNMVDHGIEPPHEREDTGKAPEGNITIKLEKQAQAWMICLGDDGRGISRAAVEARARQAGLLGPDQTASDEAILEFLFQPGMSTASEVTEVSGRGVGLAAVREVVQEMGGSISIQTRPGRGTEFDIIIPFKKGAS